MPDYSIEVSNLQKKFGKFVAVDNISFNVKKGEIFGFLGPNGAGKTTTIRMLCGLMDKTSGSAKVYGYDIATQSEELKNHIGYMSQKFSLYDDLTVSENIDFYAGMYQTNKAGREKRKNEILSEAGLQNNKKTITGTLSSSTKQHLALGCSMIHDPKIIFLDEPTAGVDPISRRAFWAIIRSLSAQGITSLVSTHYMDEAEHCDRIAIINSGKIVACDSPANLKAMVTKSTGAKSPTLEDVFVFYIGEEANTQ